MRRTLSIVTAVVLAIAVIATVVVASRDGDSKKVQVVRGAIGSEYEPFFADARVKAVFRSKGFDVQVDPAETRAIATTVDLSRYDLAFPGGSPAAQKIRTDRNINSSYVPFFTPMTVATFTPIAQLLARAGVAKDHGGWWTLDMKGFLELVNKGTRWNELAGNTSYPSGKQIVISSGDIATSNSAAMYASIASDVANSNNVVDNPAQVDHVVNEVSPLFLRQSDTDRSTKSVFDDYLSIGIGKTPMAMIYEAQFVARAAINDGSIQPNMVLMYPDPDIISKPTLVPLTANGDAVGRLLDTHATLQQLAVEYGFRTATPGVFAGFVRQHGVSVPARLGNVIEPPSYDNLEALIDRLIAGLSVPGEP